MVLTIRIPELRKLRKELNLAEKVKSPNGKSKTKSQPQSQDSYFGSLHRTDKLYEAKSVAEQSQILYELEQEMKKKKARISIPKESLEARSKK